MFLCVCVYVFLLSSPTSLCVSWFFTKHILFALFFGSLLTFETYLLCIHIASIEKHLENSFFEPRNNIFEEWNTIQKFSSIVMYKHAYERYTTHSAYSSMYLLDRENWCGAIKCAWSNIGSRFSHCYIRKKAVLLSFGLPSLFLFFFFLIVHRSFHSVWYIQYQQLVRL